MDGKALTNKKIWFRYVNISESQLSRLQALCPQALANRQRFSKIKTSSGRVASIPLQEGNDYSWICAFIEEEGLSNESYDIFISLTTELDSEIVETPQFVLDLLAKTKGKLLFSFTVIFDEED